MSLDIEQRLRVFLASSPQRVALMQTVQISHSAMSKVFSLWDQPYSDSVVVDGTPTVMEPCAMEIRRAGSPSHLDQKFDILMDTTDVMDVFREEMKRIPIESGEKVQIVYREYLSDDLVNWQTKALLQVESVSYRLGAATISAVSPRLNVTRTGEVYSPKDVPMLRGFL